MESKKYEYVGVGVERKIDGREVRVYQIRAVKTFVNAATGIKVKRGELGGYITKNALSQNGTCWVDETSVVVSDNERTMVYNDAFVGNKSKVCGNVNICDNAVVSNSTLKNHSELTMDIKDDCKVIDSTLKGNVGVKDNAILDNKCKVTGQVTIGSASHLSNCEVINNILDPLFVLEIFILDAGMGLFDKFIKNESIRYDIPTLPTRGERIF